MRQGVFSLVLQISNHMGQSIPPGICGGDSTVPRANKIRAIKCEQSVSQVKRSLNGASLHADFASLENEGRLNWRDVPYSSVTEKTHADYGTGTTNADGIAFW